MKQAKTRKLRNDDECGRQLKEPKTRSEELKEESAGFVDEWNIRDEKDVHPSHRTKVYEEDEVKEMLMKASLKGIAEGRRLQKIEDNQNIDLKELGFERGYAKALADVGKIIEHFEAEMMNTISNFRYEDKTDLIDYLDDAEKIIEKELKSKLKGMKS